MAISLTNIFKDLPIITVLDIGSAFLFDDLSTDYQTLIDTDKVRIIGFDPNTENSEKFEAKHNGKHKIYPYIIGDGTPGTFHENNFAPTSSLYPSNHALVDKFWNLGQVAMLTHTTSEVETNRLDDLQHLPGLEDVDAIFIDIQGAELETLRNATSVLKNVVLVQTEVEFLELYIDQPLFADVDIFMRESGFMFHTLISPGKRCLKPIIIKGDRNLGLNQMLWCDAIYIRDIMKFDVLSDEKLLKFAFIVNDVYSSIDFCYLALEELDRRNNTKLKHIYFEATAKN